MRLRGVIPYLAIFSVWAFFAFPFFIKNETPFPAKFQNAFFAPWNAYPELGGPIKNAAMPDVIGQMYPWRTFTIDTWKSGFVPLWNPYSFSGTPHLANYQSAVFSPLNIGFFIFRFVDWWTMLIVLQPLLAGFFTYLYVKTIKQKLLPSLISAISFMFCGFLVTWMGYGTLDYAILFLPLALYSVEKYFSAHRSKYLALLSFTIPLSFFSGHFQISIYFLLFLLSYLFFKLVQTKNIHATISSFLSVIFGLFLAAPQLFPSIELYTQSFRSTIFTKTEVIPWAYVPSFIAPDFFGNPVTGNDWFGHYAEWNAYIGITPFFLACYSLFSTKKSYALFFMISLFVSLLLAFPSPLLDFLVFLKIPVLSTSAASRIIVLFSFSASILAAFGLEKMIQDISARKYRHIAILLGIFFLAFTVLWGIVAFKLFLPVDKISIASSNLKLPILIFITLFIALMGLILLKNRKTQTLILVVLIVLTAADLLRFVYKWQSYDPKERVVAATGVSRFYPSIERIERAFGNFGAEGMMYYRLLGVEGYDAVYIRRYGQFIASLSDGKLKDSYRSVVSFPKTGIYSLQAANLLGIKYIIHKISDGQRIWAFPFWQYDIKTQKLIFDDGHYQILKNTNAFPRAFLVNSVVKQSNPQKILDTMFSSKTNLRNTAVVEEDLSPLVKLSSGSTKIISYTPNNIIVKTSSNGPSFLVLTDSYYPGWKVKVDGMNSKIYRTDFTFRGVEVPKGSHTVEFSYLPQSFIYGVFTAIIGILGIVILSFMNFRGGIIYKRK